VEYLSKLGKAEAALLKRIDNSKLNYFLEESDLSGDPQEFVLHHLTQDFSGLPRCTIVIVENEIKQLANCPTQIYFDDETNGHCIAGHTKWYEQNIRPMMVLLRHSLITEEKLELADQEERQSLKLFYIDLTAIGREFLARCGGCQQASR
jgi:hypothetical protein